MQQTVDPTPGTPGYAALPGVDLWYTDTGGTGVPVVLLHAASGTAETWQQNSKAFSAAGYRAIAFDRRGWGRTRINQKMGPQPSTAAGDLDALADFLGIGRFHLLGAAAGGSIAYDYARWRPERLLRLIVVASGASGLGDPELAATRARVQFPAFREWPVRYRELSQGYLARDPRGTARWEEIHSRARHRDTPSQPLRAPLTVAALESIAIPTLLLAGEADLTQPPWVIRFQAEHVPGAEFRLISESGHAINWEQPEVFNRVVLDFMGRH